MRVTPHKPWADYHNPSPDMVVKLKAEASKHNVSWCAVCAVAKCSFTSAGTGGRFDLTRAQIVKDCWEAISESQAERACMTLTAAGWWVTVTPACSNGRNGGPGRAPVRQIMVGWWGAKAVEDPNHAAVGEVIVPRSEPNLAAVYRGPLRNSSKKKSPLPPKHDHVQPPAAAGGQCIENVGERIEVEHTAAFEAKERDVIDEIAQQLFKKSAAVVEVRTAKGLLAAKRSEAKALVKHFLRGPNGSLWALRIEHADTYRVAQAIAAQGEATPGLIGQLDDDVARALHLAVTV